MANSAISTSSGFESTKAILSVVIFSFIVYLLVGLPITILPIFTVKTLNYSPFLAGVIISLQYVATLLTRPKSGQLADKYGAKKVLLWGLTSCSLSGLVTLVAMMVSSNSPLLSFTLIALGRLFLGVGESFGSTGTLMWGMSLVNSTQTSKVISWNGAATYLSMALGAPLGIMLNHSFGLYTFTLFTIGLALLGFIIAFYKPYIQPVRSIKHRVPFKTVLHRIWPFGTGLAMGTIGFGAISTFITLYFMEQNWSNAAFALSLFSIGFVITRFIFSKAIDKFGGARVAMVAFTVEALGLLIIWFTPYQLYVYLGALFVGCGFSLIFPALGIESIKKVDANSYGAALGTFTAFFDLALMLIGPVAGLIITYAGMRNFYGICSLVIFMTAIFLLLLTLKNKKEKTHLIS